MIKYTVTEDIEKSKRKTITKGTVLELKNNNFYLGDEWVCSKDSYIGTNCTKYKCARSRVKGVTAKC